MLSNKDLNQDKKINIVQNKNIQLSQYSIQEIEDHYKEIALR